MKINRRVILIIGFAVMLFTATASTAEDRPVAVKWNAQTGEVLGMGIKEVLPQVKAALIVDHTSIKPGQAVQAAVFLTHYRSWHTYWRNPGDSGMPTQIQWKLPAGFKAGEGRWSYPERFFTGEIANYGYSAMSAIFTTIKTPEKLVVGAEVILQAKVNWLACREVCIPQSFDVQAKVLIGEENIMSPPRVMKLMKKYSDQIPVIDPNLKVSASEDKKNFWIKVQKIRSADLTLENGYFFPYDNSLIDHAGVQYSKRGKEGVYIKIPKSGITEKSPAVLEGILKFSRENESEFPDYAIEVSAPIENIKEWKELRRLEKPLFVKILPFLVILAGLFSGYFLIKKLRKP